MTSDATVSPSELAESLRQKVAKALYETAVRSARQDAEQFKRGLDKIHQTFDLSLKESDRSCAIALFSLIEDLMKSCLEHNMNRKASGGFEAIFSGNGVLATASDRIAVLQLLYWITDQTTKDLKILKSIRNKFAHDVSVNSFEDREVNSLIASLSQGEKPILEVIPERSKPDKFTARDLFLLRAFSVIVGLATDLSSRPFARAHRVQPSDVLGREFDERSDDQQRLQRITASHFLAVMRKRRGVERRKARQTS